MYFVFQAEDGIRDYKVTGVQTCALPICGEVRLRGLRGRRGRRPRLLDGGGARARTEQEREESEAERRFLHRLPCLTFGEKRSEERRVGKECRARGVVGP